MNDSIRPFLTMAVIGLLSGTLSVVALWLPYCDLWMPGALFGALIAIPFRKTSRNSPELFIRCSAVAAIAYFAAYVTFRNLESNSLGSNEFINNSHTIVATTAAGFVGAAVVGLGVIHSVGRWPSWVVLAEMAAAGTLSGSIFGSLLVMISQDFPPWPMRPAVVLKIALAFLVWQTCTAIPLARLLTAAPKPVPSPDELA
ncbi:MAG TPA: hypothetical protein VG406_27570 [Isosphaeraceae bacterium]|nr:hypothetical protein [Isosphaeraceae bacterium]